MWLYSRPLCICRGLVPALPPWTLKSTDVHIFAIKWQNLHLTYVHLPLCFTSSLDYLEDLTQCKCYVNCCCAYCLEKNGKKMKGLYVLSADALFPKIFDPQMVESAYVESETQRADYSRIQTLPEVTWAVWIPHDWCPHAKRRLEHRHPRKTRWGYKEKMAFKPRRKTSEETNSDDPPPQSSHLQNARKTIFSHWSPSVCGTMLGQP